MTNTQSDTNTTFDDTRAWVEYMTDTGLTYADGSAPS